MNKKPINKTDSSNCHFHAVPQGKYNLSWWIVWSRSFLLFGFSESIPPIRCTFIAYTKQPIKKKMITARKKAEFWIIDESSGIGWFNLISLKPSLENPETINQPNEI